MSVRAHSNIRMSEQYERRPPSVTRFVLADGRNAALVPRERNHLSTLQNGYPLTESFLDELATDGIETIIIDDGEELHLFELSRYRRGNRVGHAPYPMKRVVSLDDAADQLGDPTTRSIHGADEAGDAPDEWEWVIEAELQPARERSGSGEQSPETGVEDVHEGSVAH